MVRTKLRQVEQVQASDVYSDAVVSANTVPTDPSTAPQSLEQDLNVLRTLMKQVKGTANWYDLTSLDGDNLSLTFLAEQDQLIRSEFAAEDASIRSEFAAEDASIRSEFAAEDASIRSEFAAEDASIRSEFAAEDAEIRFEFAAEDASIRSEFAAEDASIRTDFAAADADLRADIIAAIGTITTAGQKASFILGPSDVRVTADGSSSILSVTSPDRGAAIVADLGTEIYLNGVLQLTDTSLKSSVSAVSDDVFIVTGGTSLKFAYTLAEGDIVTLKKISISEDLDRLIN